MSQILFSRCGGIPLNLYMCFVFASTAQIQENSVHHHFSPCHWSRGCQSPHMGTEVLKLYESTAVLRCLDYVGRCLQSCFYYYFKAIANDSSLT